MTRHGGQATDITDILKMPKAERRIRKERRFLNQEKSKQGKGRGLKIRLAPALARSPR